MVYERVRGWTSGRSLPPYKTLLSTPPPGGVGTRHIKGRYVFHVQVEEKVRKYYHFIAV